MIEGIDVSNHQPRVDWPRVRRAGIQFAYVKATEGVGYVDPLAGAHAAGARSVGMARGFYHFARPDSYSGRTLETVRRDARAEAESFLAVAAPRPGDLLPALDLEVAGLGPKLLAAWTLAWLERVRRRTAVRPVLYCSPAFLRRLGAAARLRSYPLWIAHWDVGAPVLPSGFRRYAIWQYTSSGHVDGVADRVDRDRLAEGLDLADLTYRPDTPPPSPRPNLPGPVPKPDWFWPWLRWRLGVAEFEGLAREPGLRPDEAPATIPDWARQCERKIRDARR